MSCEETLLQQLSDDLEADRLVLPTLPEIALRVRDAVEDERVTVAQVADIVATDPALSARLLQIANSPLYRARNPIDNIHTAVSRIGSVQVRNLVTSVVMQQMFQATNDLLDRRLRETWEHGVEVAAISVALVAKIPGLAKDQALLAGLLHDVGVLPILVRAEDMPELLEDQRALDQVIAQLHPVIGEKILTSWRFPNTIIAATAEHENILRDPGGVADYVDVVIAANLQSYLGTSHPHAQLEWDQVPAFERLGLEPSVNFVEIEEHQQDIQVVHEMFR